MEFTSDILAMLEESTGAVGKEFGPFHSQNGSACSSEASISNVKTRRPSLTFSGINQIVAPLPAPTNSTLLYGLESTTTQARVEARLQAHENAWQRFKNETSNRLGCAPNDLVISRSEKWRDTQMVSCRRS